MPDTTSDRDQLAVNALRFLAVDMVETANSGHPGAPMGQAALAYELWARHLRADPSTPSWPNRDRFVLSCGHASALIYSLLHLAGYDLPLDELRNFRQLGSKTPGHPEHGLTAGVETTTGPLGQGVSNAVGMAIAERMLGARFNRDGFTLFDHRVWALASDGDLMEGVSSEACSLAGHLGLGKLNVIWDDNKITIDGSTDLAFTEDVKARFEAYGWHTLVIEDGNDLAAIGKALHAAEDESERPTLIVARTHIGFGSPNKQDTSGVHGSPLGAEERKLTKEALGWPSESEFHIPDAAHTAFDGLRERGAEARRAWEDLLERYIDAHPEAATELRRRLAKELPDGWQDALPSWSASDGAMATRKASGAVLNAIAPLLPHLVGGSADLAGSNNTMIKGEEIFSADAPQGRNFCFGVREHGAAAAANGMALSGLLQPYLGTFLVFADYLRPSLRLAAMMEQPVVYVLTHDSIFLGEDGPTHQPEAHLASLRAMPNVVVLRPADANETAAAWKVAVERHDGPTVLALTRQGLPILAGGTEGNALEGVARGAYVVADADDPQVLLLATGSEVSLAVAAQAELAAKGIRGRVVSMPSWELFAAQDAAYRESVLPSGVTKRLAIEAAAPFGWHRWVGTEGEILGLEGFGASAPAKALAEHFGFTPENVVRRVETMLA